MPFLLNASPDKNALRRLARQRRRALTDAQRALAQRHIAESLCDHVDRNGWQRIAAYAAVASELDLSAFFSVARDLELALPAIGVDGAMTFRAWRPGEALIPGAFAIPQPSDLSPTRDPRGFDAVLLPLLGFDRRGVRLGSGAGYYDRCFAFRRETVAPRLIGVAFSAQRFDALPADPWDVRLDAVVTENGWLDCAR